MVSVFFFFFCWGFVTCLVFFSMEIVKKGGNWKIKGGKGKLYLSLGSVFLYVNFES